MSYEVVEAPKQEGQTKASAVASLRKARPGFRVVTFVEDGDVWKATLQERKSASKRTAEFPFEKDEDSDEAPKAEEKDDDDDSDDDDDDEKSEKSEEKSEDKGEEKGDEKAKALDRLKDLVGEIQGLFDELGGHAEEVAADAEGKQEKLDEAHKVLSPDASPEGPALAPESLPELGGKPPVPGAGAGPAAVGPSAGPGGQKGPAQRKQPRRPAPMGPSAFSNLRRRTEIATHPSVDEDGNRISLVAAAQALESDKQFEGYEIKDIRNDGAVIRAKLQLRDSK